jgi:succinate dehydrogenase / fumarate reductase flavoprotein subunit
MKALKKEFWANVRVPGEMNNLNPELEKAGRVADAIEMGILMAQDALDRKESCGGHFREESVTEDGEAKRDDDNFTYVSCWEYQGEDKDPVLNKEDLVFENIELTQRSYK